MKWKIAAICSVGYLVGVLLWLSTITAWLAVKRVGWTYAPALWFDSVYQLAFQTRFGGEFLIVTLHLWGSVAAALALAWARRRTRPLMSVSGLLLTIVCFSLVFASVRWFDHETREYFRL